MALVTPTETSRRAYEGGYTIGAFNVNNMEIVQGIMKAAAELEPPVILQASVGARKYVNSIYFVELVKVAMELRPEVLIMLHLDYGADFATYKDCIDGGFTPVMIDYSGHSLEEDITETRKAVEYAHAYDAVVEIELGTLASVEGGVCAKEGMFSHTRPEEVEGLASRTGCGSLAIAVGTSHGAYKFKPGARPQLRPDILGEVKKRLPGFPIVLHGASSVPQEHVKIINTNGGQLKDTADVPEDQSHEAARSAVCKINIGSDLCLGMTAGIRQHFSEHPDHFDPKQYLGDGRANIKAVITHRITGVLGSNNRI